MYMTLALHLFLFLQICLYFKAFFPWVLSFKQHFLYSTHFAVKGMYSFLHFTCWQIEMCSFPHSLKKWVRTREASPSCHLSIHPASSPPCLHCWRHCLPTLPSDCSHICEHSATEIRPGLSQIGQWKVVSSHLWKSWFPWHSWLRRQQWKEVRRGLCCLMESLMP